MVGFAKTLEKVRPKFLHVNVIVNKGLAERS